MGEAGTREDGATRRLLQSTNDHLTDSGALDHDVRLDSRLGDGSSVIVRPELGDQSRLGSVCHEVYNVRLEATLTGEQRSEKTDGTGSGDQRHPGLEPGAGADPHRMLPRLRHHGGGLQQHPKIAQRWIQTHREAWVDAKSLTSIAVVTQNPPLNETAGLAHVPLVSRTSRAG